MRRRTDAAWELMASPCRVCPRGCKVDRRADDQRGFCRIGARAVVSSFAPHFGEEPPLVGTGGSGTIFLTSCNLACVYCQNWEISQARWGRPVANEQLAGAMLKLQNLGCHNINFVSPTVHVPQILAALPYAIEGGLRVPLVYNTGSYDSLEILGLLDGVFDIYMPDMKYVDDAVAGKYSFVKDYYSVAKAAVKEMHRQVGDLVEADDGVAVRGLIIRHLVLPDGLAGTAEVMRFIATNFSMATRSFLRVKCLQSLQLLGESSAQAVPLRDSPAVALPVPPKPGLALALAVLGVCVTLALFTGCVARPVCRG